MRKYKELHVWQRGFKIAKQIYVLISELPLEEKFSLRSQITRAAVSIPSNIAEGASRNSDKEFKHFLEIALGSSYELETQLLLLKEQNWVNHEKINLTIVELEELQKMLGGFITKLKARPNT